MSSSERVYKETVNIHCSETDLRCRNEQTEYFQFHLTATTAISVQNERRDATANQKHEIFSQAVSRGKYNVHLSHFRYRVKYVFPSSSNFKPSPKLQLGIRANLHTGHILYNQFHCLRDSSQFLQPACGKHKKEPLQLCSPALIFCLLLRALAEYYTGFFL